VQPTTPTYSARDRAGYGAAELAITSFNAVPGLLLLPLLTDSLGVAAWLAGLIVFAPKAWNVLLNPFVGRLSDGFVHPHGPRRPFLLPAVLALAVGFAVLFAVPAGLGSGLGALWVFLAFLACATAFSFFQIPFNTVLTEITDDYDERTRFMAWRVTILAVVILITGGASPLLRDAIGYPAVGIFVGTLIAAGAWLSWRSLGRARFRRTEAAGGALREQLSLVLGNGPFRAIAAVWMLQAFGTGMVLAGVDYVARHVLGSESASSVLFVCFVGPAIVLTPAWELLARRFDRRTGLALATGLLALGGLATWGALHLGIVTTCATIAVMGGGYAGCQIFPPAMMNDVAAADATATGQNRAGVFTGLWSGGETLGLAGGPLAFGLVLAAGGYVSSAGGAAQPDSALTAIEAGFTWIPTLVVAATLFAVFRFPAGGRD